MGEWQLIETAPAEKIVMTKIHDVDGGHNFAAMRRSGNLWFIPGPAGMYVYYRPTHWMPLPEPPEKCSLCQIFSP